MELIEAIEKEKSIILEENEMIDIYQEDIKRTKNKDHIGLLESYITQCEKNKRYHLQIVKWLEELSEIKKNEKSK